MKKLMTVLASAALAFGLYAEDAVVADGTSFEAEEPGVVEGDPATFDVDTATGWTFEGEDPLEIGEYDEEVLPYGDPLPDRWDEKFPKTKKNERFLNLDTGTEKLTRTLPGAEKYVVDQLVKFSGFDEVQTNFVDGAKIAVWMSDFEPETEDGANETNLYVTAGKIMDGEAEPTAIKIAGNWKLQKWYRLTIKSIGNIYQDDYTDDARAGFVVYIDGQKVSGGDVAKALVQVSGKLNTEASKLYAEGKLFPAIDGEDLKFNEVAYAGTGAIDDVAGDVKGQQFTIDTVEVTFKTVPNASIASVIGADGEITPDEKGVYAVTPDTSITVTWEAGEGYFLKKDTAEYTITDAIEIDPADADIEAEELVLVVTYDGTEEENFSNILEALAAVEDYQEKNPGAEIEVVFIKAAEIPSAYAFAADTTIAISDDSADEPEYVSSYWEVSGGDVSFLVGLENNKVVTFEDNKGTYKLTFAGLLKAGASLKAADITAAADAIELTPETAKVISQNAELDAAFNVPTGYALDKVTDADGWTTYTLVEKQAELPEATVTKIDAEGYDVAVKFDADDQGDGYDDWQAKFILTSDVAIGADEIALGGSYEAWQEGAWIDIPFAGCDAGAEVDVLEAAGIQDPITVDDVFNIIESFKCGVKNIALKNDATFTLKLVIVNPDNEADVEELCSIDDLKVAKKEFTVMTTGGQNATVTVNPEKGVVGTQVTITATANENYTYEGVETTDWEKEGETLTKVVTVAAEGNEYAVPNAVEKQAQDWDVPSGDEDKPAQEVWKTIPQALADVPAGKLSTWAKTNGIKQDAVFTADMVDAYALNCAPAELESAKATAVAAIEITSITFDAEKGEWVITTAAGEDGDAYGANGELKLVEITDQIEGVDAKNAKLWKMTIVPAAAAK